MDMFYPNLNHFLYSALCPNFFMLFSVRTNQSQQVSKRFVGEVCFLQLVLIVDVWQDGKHINVKINVKIKLCKLQWVTVTNTI